VIKNLEEDNFSAKDLSSYYLWNPDKNKEKLELSEEN